MRKRFDLRKSIDLLDETFTVAHVMNLCDPFVAVLVRAGNEKTVADSYVVDSIVHADDVPWRVMHRIESGRFQARLWEDTIRNRAIVLQAIERRKEEKENLCR